MIVLLSTLFSLAASAGPVAPADSINRIHVPPGIHVELIAAEPDVVDPVAVAFDELGRMFVIENRGYPENDSGAGCVALLTDDDGDGIYTRVSTFAEGLGFPNGVMPWKGGIIVTDAPHVLFLKDTDGDHVADVREMLLDGFSLGGSTQLRVSHPTLALENWIHFSNGLSGGDVQSPSAPDANALSMGLYDLRFDPFTGAVETTGGRAQFGLTFDDFGHKFVCSNRNHIQHVVLSPHDLARNPALTFSKTAHDIPEHGAASSVFPLTGAPTTAYAHAGTFTAACGLVIYRGTSLPEEYQGNAFVCEPTGNLVHRDVLKPAGATFVARRGQEDVEFLASEDDWFRPVFLANGPGGALYLCDMYRATIEHPTYLPGEVAAVTDFEAGNDRGRIYRITGATRDTRPLNQIDTAALVERLSDGDSWSRDTAHRLLVEQRNPSAVPRLRQLLNSKASTTARIHVLSLLDGFVALEERDVLATLSDGDGAVREFAARLARKRSPRSDELTAALNRLADDADAHVRFGAALALGDSAMPSAIDPLVRILLAASDDEWTRAAVLSGIRGSSTEFAERLFLAFGDEEPNGATARAIGGLIGRENSFEDAAAAAARSLLRGSPEGQGWKMAFLDGIVAGSSNSSPLEQLRDAISPGAVTRLNETIAVAMKWATDNGQSVEARLTAIDFLGAASFESSSDALERLLTPATPAEIQTRAIRALFRARDERAAALVLTEVRWNAFTGQARDAALTGLLSVPAGALQLLDALESGAVPAWSIPAQYRARMLRHGDADVQARAKAAFQAEPQQDRMQVYEDHRPILELVGDPANGRAVFENTCASCHRFTDLGHEVGPDLTGIGSQTSDSILLHILVPNWLKLPGYESYIVETADLEEFTGIIAAESEAAVTLRAAYGVENVIPREAITSMRVMALSMMPAELEQTMTRQELRDLIAFLKRESVQ